MPDPCPQKEWLSFNPWLLLIVKLSSMSVMSTSNDAFFKLSSFDLTLWEPLTQLYSSAPSQKRIVQHLISPPCPHLITLLSRGRSMRKVAATLLEGNFKTGRPTSLRKRSRKIQRKQKESKERMSVPRHLVNLQEQRARRRLDPRRGGDEATVGLSESLTLVSLLAILLQSDHLIM
jgi:hypothetical protein